MATPTTIFGWFQTHLNVSLESSNCLGAAKLQHKKKVLERLEAGQTHTHRVNSQSNSGPWQFNIGLQAGVPVMQGKVGVSKSTKTKSLLTELYLRFQTNKSLVGLSQ
jgi:hypothetical protein